MLPPELNLEVRSQTPPPGARLPPRPPLLFVHGGFCDAWCWEPYFLPWFAKHGYAAHALSLRGHGRSGGRESVFLAGLDDYAADVERVASELEQAPVLIGHSLGAAVVERLLATRPIRAAALLAPVPPAGLMIVASRLAVERPEYFLHANPIDAGNLPAEVLRTLKPYFFSDAAPPVMAEAVKHLGFESPRALFDLALRLHWQLPERNNVPVLVLGAQGDRICTPDDVHATARHHHVEAVMIEGAAHMMMLERQWERAARAIERWVAKVE